MTLTIALPRALRRTRACLALSGALALLAGCQPTGPISPKPGDTFDASAVATHDDITAIHSFWREPPWVVDAGRVIGFRTRVYLRSASTELGEFVPGTLIVKVFVRSQGPHGDVERTLAHEWRLPAADAMNFRITRRELMGNSYGLVLLWPPELDLSGREIDVQFIYERLTGVTIPSPPKYFRVP